MVLKKPYAFLIRHFRLIHVVLTFLSVFIAVESYRTVSFFTNFIKNDYSATIIDNMVAEYISSLLYMSLILIIIILIVMSLLLKIKNKPIRAYIVAIIYYIILIIFLIVASVLIGGLVIELWSTAAARSYRDIALIIYYPQFIFIIILAVRAIGFNVKKFNFKNDLKEMEITDADNEEVELNFNFDVSTVKRKARRFVRETGYYYKENKLIIMLIAIIGLLIIGFTIYRNYEKMVYNYKEGDIFNFNGLQLKVTNSIITNTDLKGNLLSNDSAYLIISIDITNNSRDDIDFKYDYLKLYFANKYSYPDLNISNYFIDCGVPLNSSIIKTKTTHSYIIPYVIDKQNINSNFYIGVYIGNSAKKKQFKAKNAIVKLKPEKFLDTSVVKIANIGDTIPFGSSIIKDATLKISNVTIASRYLYQYESCYKNNCHKYTDVVVADPTYLNRQSLIVMDYELSLDKSSASYEKINNINSFMSSFATVEYGNTANNLLVSSIKYVTPANLKDKAVLQVDGGVIGANKVNLLITIRNRIYKIVLKDE